MPENETPSTHGDASKPLTLEDVQRLFDKQLGDAHIQKRGLATGVIKDREFRESHDEQVRFLAGMAGTAALVTVEHDLGRIPGYVRLVGTETPAGIAPAHVTLADVDYSRWTTTTARIEVMLQGPGGLENVTVKVLVGGSRG